jgi:hypothetical protein
MLIGQISLKLGSGDKCLCFKFYWASATRATMLIHQISVNKLVIATNAMHQISLVMVLVMRQQAHLIQISLVDTGEMQQMQGTQIS